MIVQGTISQRLDKYPDFCYLVPVYSPVLFDGSFVAKDATIVYKTVERTDYILTFSETNEFGWSMAVLSLIPNKHTLAKHMLVVHERECNNIPKLWKSHTQEILKVVFGV